jgi:putative spermidine/putrescine transport system permease protein
VIGLLGGVLQSLGYFPEVGIQKFTLDNYLKIFETQNLTASIFLSLYVTLTSTLISTIAGVLITYFVVVTNKTHSVLYTIIKIPMLVPWTIVAFLAIDFFGGNGILASFFRVIGLDMLADLVSECIYSLNCIGIIISFTWSTIPFVSYYVMPLMESVSDSLAEAAECMGANSIQTFFHVTLPLSLPSIRTAAILSAVTNFGGYEIPLLLGMSIPRLLPVEIYSEYNSYPMSQRPEVMALCMVMVVISVMISIFIFVLFTRRKQGLRNV